MRLLLLLGDLLLVAVDLKPHGLAHILLELLQLHLVHISLVEGRGRD